MTGCLLAWLLGLSGPPAPRVIAVTPDAGAAPREDDRRLIDDLELLRNYELLRVYPLLAPP